MRPGSAPGRNSAARHTGSASGALSDPPQNGGWWLVAGGGWPVAGEELSSPATHHPPPATRYPGSGLGGFGSLFSSSVFAGDTGLDRLTVGEGLPQPQAIARRKAPVIPTISRERLKPRIIAILPQGHPGRPNYQAL